MSLYFRKALRLASSKEVFLGVPRAQSARLVPTFHAGSASPSNPNVIKVSTIVLLSRYSVQRSSHAQWSSFLLCGVAYSDSPLHNFLSYLWSTFRKRTIGRSSSTFTCVKFFFLLVINVMSLFARGTRWRSWLRHCATNRKVASSIPDGVTGIFQCLNPSGRIVALGSTQPLKMSTRNPSWV